MDLDDDDEALATPISHVMGEDEEFKDLLEGGEAEDEKEKEEKKRSPTIDWVEFEDEPYVEQVLEKGGYYSSVET